MVTEVRYTTIHRVLDSLKDHPMLADLTLEQAVRYAIRFISKHGYSKLYQDKIADVETHDFRAMMPCDLINIVQVKDLKTGLCLRSMTDNFPMGMQPTPTKDCVDPMNNMRTMPYIPPRAPMHGDPAFKTQGRVIFTSFPEGMIQIAYKAIPVDEDGFPMLIDNEVYLDALEAYIKKQVFTIKYDQQKIAAGVLQNAQVEYAVASKLLLSEFSTPSPSEAESLAVIWNTMIPRMREFSHGFKDTGTREYLRKQ